MFVVCLWLLYLALYHGISSLLDLTYWDCGQVWSFSPAEALHAFCKDCSGLVPARAVFLCPNCKEVSAPLVGGGCSPRPLFLLICYLSGESSTKFFHYLHLHCLKKKAFVLCIVAENFKSIPTLLCVGVL